MTDRPRRAWCTSYRARWVLPVASGPLRDGAVVVEGDRIAWVGRAGHEPPALKAGVVELGDMVLTPGLVNAHTHLDLTVLRGLLDGLPFFDWIRGVVACRDALTNDERLDSARLGILEGIAHGVTTFADTSPDATAFDAMRELGVRGMAYLEVFGPDPASAAAAVASLRDRVTDLRRRATHLVGLGVSPHAPYSVSDALYAGTAALARELGVPLAAHIAESVVETQLVAGGSGPFADFLRGRAIPVAPRGRTSVELLAQHGVLGPGALLIHCVQCDERDITAIARSGSAVATCPHSNRYFGHGAAPVRALRAAGVRVGVGSDSMASNSAMDVRAEAVSALAGPGVADPLDHWALATRDGARALGLGDVTGTLEPGKAADLAAFPTLGSTSDASPLPPCSALAALVVVAGVARRREGRTVGVDGDAVTRRAQHAADRLRKWRLGATQR